MRIRSIRPEFWRSTDIAALPRDVRLLFIGLWSYVDDNGVGIDDHKVIAADLFALDDDPIGARAFVRDGLARLSRALLIVRYTHSGKAYLHIPTWDKHQRVDKPGSPRYPRPDEVNATIQTEATGGNSDVNGSNRDVDGDGSTGFATVSRDSREGLAPGEGEKGRRGEGEKRTKNMASSSPSASDDDEREDHGLFDSETGTAPATKAATPPARKPKTLPDDPLFAEFYENAYPRKVKRPRARKEWKDALKAGADPEAIVASARAHAEAWKRAGTATQFIPHPASWLNSAGYDDDPADIAPPPEPAAAAGGHHPYQNPTDPNAYHEGNL